MSNWRSDWIRAVYCNWSSNLKNGAAMPQLWFSLMRYRPYWLFLIRWNHLKQLNLIVWASMWQMASNRCRMGTKNTDLLHAVHAWQLWKLCTTPSNLILLWIDHSSSFPWLIREISESCCKSEGWEYDSFVLDWQIMLHWFSRLVHATIRSYTVLWLFNENVIIFQAELFMLYNVLKPI